MMGPGMDHRGHARKVHVVMTFNVIFEYSTDFKYLTNSSQKCQLCLDLLSYKKCLMNTIPDDILPFNNEESLDRF